jgi:hypothetical protein
MSGLDWFILILLAGYFIARRRVHRWQLQRRTRR